LSSKGNFSGTTTKRYALALYELGKENSEIDKIEVESRSIQELFHNSLEFKNLIKDPTNSKNEQMNVIKNICSKFSFSNTFTKFLCLLCFKRRLFYLDKILDNFTNIISKSKGEIKAQLNSSKKLSPDELKNIQEELSESFTSKIILEYKYDPSLIGGLIIKVGSVMIDASIKNQLKKLETKMIEA